MVLLSATDGTEGRAKAASSEKCDSGLLAQLGREPSFAESMPAGIQQRPTEPYAA
jgi:hypothetical protein